MYRFAFLLLGFSIVTFTASGQDIILRSDSVSIRATVLEAKPYEISYKLFDKPDSPTYIINTYDVLSIAFANGEKRVFERPVLRKRDIDPYEFEKILGRNIVGIRIFDLFYANLSLTYERISAKGKTGFKIPISIGLDNNSSNRSYEYAYNRNKTFSTGLEINFYTNGQGKFRYFFGPAFQLGFFKYTYYIYDNNNPSTPIYQSNQGQHYGLLLNNGVYYQFTKTFMISLDAGLGFRRRVVNNASYGYYGYSNIDLHASGNLNIGFRF